MARIRTIKPDFWDDEKVARLPFQSRLTYIGMWNHSDDYAVIKGNLAWLKNHIYPYDDDLGLPDFTKWIAELVLRDFIRPFDVNNEQFFYIRTFKKHQRIDKPSKLNRNPPAPENVINDSYTIPRVFQEYSLSDSGGLSTVSSKVDSKSKALLNKFNRAESDDSDPSSQSNHFKTKIGDQLDSILDTCRKLDGFNNGKKYFNPYQFVQSWANQRGHPSAILDSLNGLLSQWHDVKKSKWAYANAIMKTKNGNYNERDHVEQSAQFQITWQEASPRLKSLINGIGSVTR